MEIFVTGGTGNIGQHVTLALLERGRARRGEELRLHLFHRRPGQELHLLVRYRLHGQGNDPRIQEPDHIVWNLERAKAAKEGKEVHNVLHVW